MEQKRVLWIVAAVGLFLTVTLGTALIVYRPAKNQTPVLNPQLSSSTWTRESPATEASPVTQTPVPDQSAESAAVPVTDTPAQVTNLTVISANTNVISDGTKTIDLSALTQEKPSEQPSAAQTQPVQPPVAAVATAEITVKTVTEPVTATPAPATTKATKAAAAAVKTATTKIPDQFWVQAASFTQKINAEEARDALAAEKIPGEVFTWKDDKGVVYYRLRVGPYTTKSEADFWLSRIKEIGAFASTSSYVVNSSEKAAN